MENAEHNASRRSGRDGVTFESLSTTPVVRHKLRFKTRDDLLAAVEQCREQGHVRFRNGGEHDLIGRIVRVSEELLILEIDAAADV